MVAWEDNGCSLELPIAALSIGATDTKAVHAP